MRRGSPKFSFALAACAAACLLGALGASGCKGKSDVSPRPAASASSAAGQTTPQADLAIEGAGFSGTLRLTTSLAAPLVVFLPKTYGTRRELVPFAQRAEEMGLAAHTLVLEPPKLALVSKPPAPPTLPAEAVAPLVAAIRAAIGAVDARVGGQPPLVLVGSDFGCTLLARVAKEEPRVRAAALLSPGPTLHGVDLYGPFAALSGKPVFIAGADHDPVSAEPLAALPAMARDKATKKLYPGVWHGAGALAQGSPVVRDDLGQWLVANVREITTPTKGEPAAAGAGSLGATPPKGTL